MNQNNPKVSAVVQARMTSTRLPGKILKDLHGKTVLERVIERVSQIQGLNHVVVAAPEGKDHEPITNLVKKISSGNICPLSSITGSETDVLGRTIKAAKSVNCDVVVRVTSDCPFIDPQVGSALLKKFLETGVDYARLDSKEGYPLGFDTEVVSLKALQIAAQSQPDDFEKEHATPYIWRRPEEFKSTVLKADVDRRAWRLVIDEPQDYKFAVKLYENLEKDRTPQDGLFTYEDIIKVLSNEPDLLEINASVAQKAMIGRLRK